MSGMSSRAKNWLLGCGLSCAVVALLGIAVLVGLGFWVRGRMQGFEESMHARDTLQQRYGESRDFVPWEDGAIPPDRMERFLAVRDATAPARDAIISSMAMIPADRADAEKIESGSFVDRLRFALRLGPAVFGMVREAAELLRARNDELLRLEVGFGEYTYVYVTAYYSALGHSPTDSPGGGRVHAGQGDSWRSSDVRRDYLAQLRNLRDRLPPSAEEDPTGWAGRLSAEIDAMETDSRRIPWQDGLPGAIRASIEPFRERLEATYSPATNPFELRHAEQRGMSIEID